MTARMAPSARARSPRWILVLRQDPQIERGADRGPTPPESQLSSPERFDAFASLSAFEFIRAQRGRERIRADLWSALDAADVLVTPTMPMTATPIGTDIVQINGEVRAKCSGG
jgi:Asp-tRNA(Asn)/Glu-tRNA(Gln) amidotransferase A subunit family amidase